MVLEAIMKRLTLHEKLVKAFENCDDTGRALHGCYASAAMDVIRRHRNQTERRKLSKVFGRK
jgi:hypothetical protein